MPSLRLNCRRKSAVESERLNYSCAHVFDSFFGDSPLMVRDLVELSADPDAVIDHAVRFSRSVRKCLCKWKPWLVEDYFDAGIAAREGRRTATRNFWREFLRRSSWGVVEILAWKHVMDNLALTAVA